MSSLKCSGCGYGIHYHDEPNDTEYMFFTLDTWAKIENETLTSSWVGGEYYELTVYAWKCPECGTFAFFDQRGKVTGVYQPTKEFSSEPMREPTEFGLFFDDILWYDIAEDDLPASEILKKYPQNLWLRKNEEEMRVYADRAMKECVAQYRRIPIASE